MLSFIPALSPQPKTSSVQKSRTPTHFQGESGLPSTLNKLTKTGLNRQEASRITTLLATEEGDFPYHAGTLITGHIFVISNQDRLFLGHRNEQLTEIPVKDSFRTRCIDNQKRVVEGRGGLRVTIENTNGIRTAKVSKLNRHSNSYEELKVGK